MRTIRALSLAFAGLLFAAATPAAACDCNCCREVLNGRLNTSDFDGGVGYGSSYGVIDAGGGGAFAAAHASAFAFARARASASAHSGFHGRSGGGVNGGWGGGHR